MPKARLLDAPILSINHHDHRKGASSVRHEIPTPHSACRVPHLFRLSLKPAEEENGEDECEADHDADADQRREQERLSTQQ